MSRLIGAEIFHPPENSATSDKISGFEFIPMDIKRKIGGSQSSITSTSTNSNAKQSNEQTNDSSSLPIVYREWKGRQGETAWLTIIYSGGFEEDLGVMSLWLDHLKDALNVKFNFFDVENL
jgi:hypothetical protein